MVEARFAATGNGPPLVIAPRITVLPLIRGGDELVDLLARMAWAIGNASFHDVVIYLADAALADVPWRVPERMDPALAANFAGLRPRVQFVVAPEKADVVERLDASDFVVFVEDPPEWDLLGEDEWAEALRRKKILRSDPRRTRQEFGNWVELNFQLRAERHVEAELCRARFARVLEECGRAETAYCLATGPSLAAFKDTNFEGAISVVCNSAILDEELMEWVRPKFLVFADPIFHFGPSGYAAEFRRRLRESCGRHDYTIIVPMRYYGLLTDAMPELRARTIGIPSDKPNGFNLDLANEFRVFTTANILTYLMLPVASTVARRIYMLGCDGRPLEESSYFWQHNKKTQINDEMANIRLVHPGFFVMDYNDYYLDHCRQLEELMREGEKMGREYGTVTPSYIPALRGRPANLPRMLVIDFTETGAASATGQLKATIFKNWAPEKILQVRPLSTRDGSFFRLHSQAAHPGFREVKLTRADVLREVGDFDPQVIYFRPTESPPEFLELGAELVERLGVPVVTHIMDDWPERLRETNPAAFARVEPTLRAVLERSAVRLSISDAMSEAYRARYGLDFVAIANGVEPADWNGAVPERGPGEPLVIRYCGGLTEDMTLASVEMVARAVGRLSAEVPMRLEIYALPAAIKIAEERFKDWPAVSVQPAVEWSAYPQLLMTAGATLIAYNFDERTRTYTQYSMANKLPECLASGVPLLVFGPETIATVRRARELGATEVVAHPDPAALDAALLRLAREPAAARATAGAARDRALTELGGDEVRRKFQESIARLELSRRNPLPPGMLLGPYTRLQRRRIDDCEVASRFFHENAGAKVAIALGPVDRENLEAFRRAGWSVVTCPVPADARRNYDSLRPDFGKDAVAVVLCRAEDFSAVEPLPIRMAGVMVVCGEGGSAPAGEFSFEACRMVWSQSYRRFGTSPDPDFRLLRELATVAEIPAGEPAVLWLLNAEVIRVRRGAGDAVVLLRKACGAALDGAGPSAPANGAANRGVAERITAWLRAWTGAIARLNVRWQVTRFCRDRIAETREIFFGSPRGRLIVWK